MTTEEYFKIKEDFGVLNATLSKIKYIMDILEIYPYMRNRTMEECEEELWDRAIRYENELQSKLIAK